MYVVPVYLTVRAVNREVAERLAHSLLAGIRDTDLQRYEVSDDIKFYPYREEK